MIAIIADIHANYPALRSVIDDIKRNGISQVYSVGDVAGYHSMVNECIEMLIDNEVEHIMGNHDYYLISGFRCERSSHVNKCLDYQRNIITKKNISWIKKSKYSYSINAINMVHGGWQDNLEEYLYKPDKDYFDNLSGRIFISGHTHIQTIMDYNGKLYCNPGSVGQPRDGNPRAAYCIIDKEKIYLQRVEYDIDMTVERMIFNGFNKYSCYNLYQGTGIGILNDID